MCGNECVHQNKSLVEVRLKLLRDKDNLLTKDDDNIMINGFS